MDGLPPPPPPLAPVGGMQGIGIENSDRMEGMAAGGDEVG
jgi:hypothetical protein